MAAALSQHCQVSGGVGRQYYGYVSRHALQSPEEDGGIGTANSQTARQIHHGKYDTHHASILQDCYSTLQHEVGLLTAALSYLIHFPEMCWRGFP